MEYILTELTKAILFAGIGVVLGRWVFDVTHR